MEKVVGICWYQAEHFLQLRAMFEDGDSLHETYGEWLSAAELGRKRLESGGAKVVCVDLDPDVFPKWCRAKGMKLDAQARTAYANWMAYQAAMGR